MLIQASTPLGEVGIGLLVAAIVAVVGLLGRRMVWPRVRAYLDQRRINEFAPMQLEQALSYLTHLRDGVMPAVWRTFEADAGQVREHIRRNILEPIRGYLATVPGEQIRVVWFRPDNDRTYLSMYEQVGHTPEGQEAARLPIGSGIAGHAFTSGTTVYCADCSSDPRFQDLPHGHRQGSIVCVPIQRAGESTGVLSVWSTWDNRFWLGDFLYFESLAAAIGSLETLE